MTHVTVKIGERYGVNVAGCGCACDFKIGGANARDSFGEAGQF